MKQSTITLAVIFLVIIVGGIGLWVFFIDWVKDTTEASESWAQAGRMHGRKTTPSGCVEQTVSMSKYCDEISCGIQNKVFLSACLKESNPEPGFCDSIPSSYSLLEAAAWEVEQCEGLENDSEICHHLFREVHRYCTTAREKK